MKKSTIHVKIVALDVIFLCVIYITISLYVHFSNLPRPVPCPYLYLSELHRYFHVGFDADLRISIQLQHKIHMLILSNEIGN